MPVSSTDDFFSTEKMGNTKDDRLGKCYEIAAYALTLGSAPVGSTLVHGSVHHIYVERRINHAWLVLPSNMIWEPISCIFWVPTAWTRIARAITHNTYTSNDVHELVIEHMHWGPWDFTQADKSVVL